jgi:hypothetical protein
MSDAQIAKFKKAFIASITEKFLKKGKDEDEASEAATHQYEKLEKNKTAFDEKFNDWLKSKGKEEKPEKEKAASSKGKRPASDDTDDEPKEEKKKATKRKAKPAPAEDGAPEKEPKAKRAKKIAPGDIPMPTKRASLNCTVHFDKNNRMFFYDHKTGESSWSISAHDFNIMFGPAMKEVGFVVGSGGKVSKKGTRKNNIHGYHVFVAEFKFDRSAVDDKTKIGKARIEQAAAAWRNLSDDQKKEWGARAKVKRDALNAASADEPGPSTKGKKPAVAPAKPTPAEIKADDSELDWD